MYRIILVLCLVFSMSLSSCFEKPVRLETEDYAMIDTLYTQKIDSLKVVLETECQAQNEARLQTIVDSLMTVRNQEIDALLRKK